MKIRNICISGHMIDIENRVIIDKKIFVQEGKIVSVEDSKNVEDVYIMPGFIDSHVHIESSMLMPDQFSEVAAKKGTVAVIADPHEITNVCGIEGIEYFISRAKKALIKFYFGAPSCVPATKFETNGYKLDHTIAGMLAKRDDIYFLAEVMNFPGVIEKDNDLIKKILAFKNAGKKVDGHAPGLLGEDLKKYIEAGIQTDHESISYDEAKQKIEEGMKIIIREGSAARNFENLYKLIDEYPDDVMLCTDDIHPDDLVKGHINNLVKKGINKGINLFNILKAACYNPVKHYGIDVGLLKKNDPADFIIVEDLKDFNVLKTFVNGRCGTEKSRNVSEKIFINNFNREEIIAEDIQISENNRKIKIIEAGNNSLFTKYFVDYPKVAYGKLVSDTDRDILKIIVLNRYNNEAASIGFVRNFGLKNCAIASSIAHDSHNIISVGSDDACILNAVNLVIRNKGGISFSSESKNEILQLPVAGLMSYEKANIVAEKYKMLNKMARNSGSEMDAPFMTLSFMALLVIPELKISDKGIFDVNNFQLTSLFEE